MIDKGVYGEKFRKHVCVVSLFAQYIFPSVAIF